MSPTSDGVAEIGVVALLVGAIVRWLKPTVAPRWRPFLALGLGAAAGVVDYVLTGRAWREALLAGLASAIVAMTGHEAVIEGARGGREIGGGP